MQEKAVAEEKKIGMTETWLRKHRLQFIGATRHPMLKTIRDGTINLASFKTWLAQEYLFVRAFVPFVASVLTKARKESDDSDHDIEVISRGMASLEDEILWFKNEADKWGISLSNIVPQQANTNYIGFLENLRKENVEYTVAITAFWAIETVYHESFAHCLEEGSKTPEELKETCARWGNQGFGLYCQSLQNIVNRCSQKASHDELKKAELVLLRVLELEVEFWNMTYASV
ncbi:hypothetical protein TanjilG_14355 [Lupinus angustifolius]|uniref:Thiaminase-2/PQQC domain-containing protein n=1 Tax=Lupinus angustifolius TaxID=3871 RepID=A0A1J7GNU4_LUPAN|nr:PREDICTED: probable bifunctional TENA-E protein [Lupinus angustifolius]OIV91776.1 hypothetical protein TanjilG_14355 [Lupinus angustifolius]